MRMMLVGAGAVGESIVKVLKWRDPERKWLEYVLICDFDKGRASGWGPDRKNRVYCRCRILLCGGSPVGRENADCFSFSLWMAQ